MVRDGSIGLHYIGDDERDDRRNQAACAEVLNIGYAAGIRGGAKYYDDRSKQPLKEDLVNAAITKELDYFDDKEVWELVPMGEAQKVTCNPR